MKMILCYFFCPEVTKLPGYKDPAVSYVGKLGDIPRTSRFGSESPSKLSSTLGFTSLKTFAFNSRST